MLETNIDQWRAIAVAEGMRLGEQKGLQISRLKARLEGQREGAANALQRLLSRRFGAISTTIVERIAVADLAQIDTWFDAAITAPDMASVFTPTRN